MKKDFVLFVITFILSSSAFAKGSLHCTPADSNSYLQEVREQLNKQWPNNRIINIVCYGHSVPAGYFKTPDVNMFEAYPHLLYTDIKKMYPYAVVNVIVAAVGGENSEAGQQRFAKDVLSHQPDVVTIDYGLNDRTIGLERAWKAWESMIKMAKAKNIKVILLTPTPDISHNPDDLNEPLNQHAQQIRRLAIKYNIGLADSLAAFEEKQKQGIKLADLLSQSNHPNNKGHRLVADKLRLFFDTDKK